MSSLSVSWALQALLSVLQGNVSTGQLVVRSTGTTGTLPKGSVAAPVIDGQLMPDAAVMVDVNENPGAPTDGSWPLTTSATLVSVTSVQAGPHVNTAAATEYRWLPGVEGVEETSESHVGGIVGGELSAELGALRTVRTDKGLGGVVGAADFFTRNVHDFPAALLEWTRTTPADGAGAPSLGPRGARLGAGRMICKHTWLLHLASSRYDGRDLRALEGELLRAAVLDLLNDRGAYRGVTISAPDGIELLDVRASLLTPTVWVDTVQFTTTFVQGRRDLASGYSDWLRSHIESKKTKAGVSPVKLLDIVVRQPPNG